MARYHGLGRRAAGHAAGPDPDPRRRHADHRHLRRRGRPRRRPAPTDQPAVEEAKPQETTGKEKRKAIKGRGGHEGAQAWSRTRTSRDARARPASARPTAPRPPPNPASRLALPGPAPIGVPNFFIDKFRIPPFLLPIYQAAGIEYGVRWEVLAAINEIETDYGRNLNVSSAGALGWMQFMPATWKLYGVDANRDGKKDPYNPVDAIFAAARYLKAAGAERDLRKAIFAYNHADWYVDSVLMRARLIGGLPADLVGSLTGLTQGHFPVHAKAALRRRPLRARRPRRIAKGRNAALPVEADASRRGIHIYAKAGSPVVAVQDGKIVRIGRTKRLGRFVQLRDVYGNTYTYAHLKKIARPTRCPSAAVTKAQVARELELPKRDPKPAARRERRQAARQERDAEADEGRRRAQRRRKERLFANPDRPAPSRPAARSSCCRPTATSSTFTVLLHQGLRPRSATTCACKPLKVGSKVIAGTILGRIGRTRARSRRTLLFEIRPAGRGAPRIDPKPILDGWKLLESTAIYRAAGQEPVLRPRRQEPVDRPDPADEQGGAAAPRARQPADRGLRVRPPRHPGRARRPPRAGDARVPRRLAA